MKAITIIKADDGSLSTTCTNLENMADQVELIHEAMQMITRVQLAPPMTADEIKRRLAGE